MSKLKLYALWLALCLSQGCVTKVLIVVTPGSDNEIIAEIQGAKDSLNGNEVDVPAVKGALK